MAGEVDRKNAITCRGQGADVTSPAVGPSTDSVQEDDRLRPDPASRTRSRTPSAACGYEIVGSSRRGRALVAVAPMLRGLRPGEGAVDHLN